MTSDDSFNCSCSVTSASRIIVAALDVRLGHTELECGEIQMVFANHTDQVYLSCEDDNVVFGSKTMIEGDQMLSIHLNMLNKLRVPNMVWLNISGKIYETCVWHMKAIKYVRFCRIRLDIKCVIKSYEKNGRRKQMEVDILIMIIN